MVIMDSEREDNQTERKVLVTGANGFIGRVVVDSLLQDSSLKVIATIRRPDAELEGIATRNNKLVVMEGIDLADKSAVARIPGEITHVVHSAALAQFKGAKAMDLIRNNIDATQNLLDHLRATSAESMQRFLYASTVGVHDRPRFYDRSKVLKESSPFVPSSKYGRTKLEGEYLVRKSGLPHVIARLTWIYGPNMRFGSHIRLFARMSKKRNITTFLNYPGRVSVAYIDDVAEAFRGLLFKEHLAHVAYFIAHPEPVSFDDIFSLYREIFEHRGRIPLPATLWHMLGIVSPLLPMLMRALIENYLVCSVDRLEAEGIRLKTSFSVGLRQSIASGGGFDD